MSELSSSLFWSVMVVLVRQLSPKDTIQVISKSHTFQLKELRSPRLSSIPIWEKLPLISGTLLVRRSLENWENVTILMPIAESSCLISLQETLTEMSINGTRTLLKCVQMFQFVWLETKLMSRIEKLKPVRLVSIEREISSITISQLNQTINLKNHSFTYSDNC